MAMLKSFFLESTVEAGLDEAGRGCLAGPVVAAFVILPNDYFHPYLNDSKQLNKKQREALKKEIEQEALDYAVAEVDNHEIDRINILNASFLAMHKALEEAKLIPELLLVDGNRFKKYQKIMHECIVQGDMKYFSIAAASILAKTHRDQLMLELSSSHPAYGWDKNMGYATLYHRKAIEKHGISPYHRKTFAPCSGQLEFF